MIVDDLEFFDKKTIAGNFNKFFSEIGPKLASKIPHSLISFEHFLHGDNPSLEEKPITDDELIEALQTLKTKKSSGYDEIFSDVFKHISPSIFEPLRYIFNLFIEKGIFPDQLEFFFFLSVFSLQILMIYRTAGEGRGPYFIPLYHYHPLTNI